MAEPQHTYIMKKEFVIPMKLLTILFFILICCILTHSRLSLHYAALGLELWFQKMIPSLLPFMILSGCMVRLNLTDKAAMILYPVVRPLYRVRKNVCYAMLMGFLCGFPMGARVVDDLYMRQMITRREAEYLLAFCNNIGPVYFCSFVLPLLGRKLVLPYVFGMYGIPLLYGLVLRYTVYRDLPLLSAGNRIPLTAATVCCGKSTSPGTALACCGKNASPGTTLSSGAHSFGERFLEAIDESVHASVQNILSLGGYMILFNLLNLIPHMLLSAPPAIFAPLLEITGGLSMLQASLPLYSLLCLSFGGLSCLAQTHSCIADSDLSISSYVLHKMILTLLNGAFYLCWFVLFPGSFLR